MKKSVFNFILLLAFFSSLFFSCDDVGFNDDLIKDIELETSVNVNVATFDNNGNTLYTANFLWRKGEKLKRSDIVKQLTGYTPGYNPKQIQFAADQEPLDSKCYESGSFSYFRNYTQEVNNQGETVDNSLNWIIVQDKDIYLTVNGLIPRNDTPVYLLVRKEGWRTGNNNEPDYKEDYEYSDYVYEAFGYTGEKASDGLRLDTVRYSHLYGYEPDLNNFVTDPECVIPFPNAENKIIEVNFKRKYDYLKIEADSDVQIFNSQTDVDLIRGDDGYYYYRSKFCVNASELVASKPGYKFEYWSAIINEEKIRTAAPYVYELEMGSKWTPVFVRDESGSASDAPVTIHVWENSPANPATGENTYNIAKSQDLRSVLNQIDTNKYTFILHCDYETDMTFSGSEFSGKSFYFYSGETSSTGDTGKYGLIYTGTESLFDSKSSDSSLRFSNLEIKASKSVMPLGIIAMGEVVFENCNLNWQNGTVNMFKVMGGSLTLNQCGFTGNMNSKPACNAEVAEITGGTVNFTGGGIKYARVNGAAGAFYVNGSGHLVLKNSTVSRCEGNMSAVVAVEESGSAEIDNCNLFDCVSTDGNYVLWTSNSNCIIRNSSLYDEEYYNSMALAPGETRYPPKTVFVKDNCSIALDGTVTTGTIVLGENSVIKILSGLTSESVQKMVVWLSETDYQYLISDSNRTLQVFTGSENLSVCTLAYIAPYNSKWNFTIAQNGFVKVRDDAVSSAY